MSESASSLLDPLGLDPAQLAAWTRLSQTAATANGFLDPSFVLPAVRHLPGGHRARLLVAARSPAQWDALALIVTGSRWRRMPLPALSTWAHDQQGLATPLLAGEDPDRAAAALVAAVGQHAPRAVLLGLDEQAGQGRTSTALDTALSAAGWRRAVWRSSQRAVLLRGEAPDPVLTDPVLTEPSRLRSKRRRLEREAGPIRIRDCSSPGEAEIGAQTLLELETAGWKGRAGTAMTQRPGETAMLLDVARMAAQRGVLRSMVLMAGQTPVAAQLDLVGADTWFHWKTAYDETYSAVSPGRLLLTHVLERFTQDEELRCWDACTVPGHPLMDALLPHRRTILEVAATRGAAAATVVRAGRTVRSWREGAR